MLPMSSHRTCYCCKFSQNVSHPAVRRLQHRILVQYLYRLKNFFSKSEHKEYVKILRVQILRTDWSIRMGFLLAKTHADKLCGKGGARTGVRDRMSDLRHVRSLRKSEKKVGREAGYNKCELWSNPCGARQAPKPLYLPRAVAPGLPPPHKKL